MSAELGLVEIAEFVLQAVGILMILVGAVVVTVRRRGGELLRLPPPASHVLTLADVLLGVLAVWVLPGLLLALFSVWGGTGAETQPASMPVGSDEHAAGRVLAIAVGQFGALVVLLFLGRARFHGGLRGWGLHGQRVGRWAAVAVAGCVAVWPVCIGVLLLTREVILLLDPAMELPEHTAITTLRSDDVPVWISGVTILSASVLAPMVEELLFRGLLQSALARWWRSQWGAVLVSGCAFGFFHMHVFDTVPALAVFGIVLGYAYARTGSLVLVVLLHAVFNCKNVLWVILGE